MVSKALLRAIADPVEIANAATPSGKLAAFYLSAAPSGWLKANGSTIGSASSGANYANAESSKLFAVLWATDSVILTSAGGASTRGANAAADFAANKRLTLPDFRGEFFRGLDDGRGIDAGRTLGSAQAEGVGVHGHTASTSVTSVSAGTPAGTVASGGAHDHDITGGSGGGTGGSGYQMGPTTSPSAHATTTDGAHTHTFTGTALAAHGHTASTTVNNSAAGENRPRNVSALICIKL